MTKYKHSGITLIELVVTMAIVLVVTSAIYSFFIPSIKSLNKIEIDNKLQNEGENAINRISENSMGVSAIVTINSVNFNEEAFNSAIEVLSISFDLFDGKAHEYKLTNNKLSFKKSGETNEKVICNFVDKLILEPIKNNENKTYGVKISIILKLNNTSKEFQNRIYFRNY